MICSIKKRYGFKSTSQLCEKTGLGRNVAYRIMRGENVGSLSMINLADALGIELSEMIAMGESKG